MVALTPAAVKRLEATSGVSFGLSDEDLAKPFIEMSGGAHRRRGGRPARHPGRRGGQGDRRPPGRGRRARRVGERARAIAVGALRYQMARQSRNRVLAFDFDEALAFEGDTGPYLQYSRCALARSSTSWPSTAWPAPPRGRRRRGRPRDPDGLLGGWSWPVGAPTRWSPRPSHPRVLAPRLPRHDLAMLFQSSTTTTRCCTPPTRRPASSAAPSSASSPPPSPTSSKRCSASRCRGDVGGTVASGL